jgi:hypothetical protein
MKAQRRNACVRAFLSGLGAGLPVPAAADTQQARPCVLALGVPPRDGPLRRYRKPRASPSGVVSHRDVYRKDDVVEPVASACINAAASDGVADESGGRLLRASATRPVVGLALRARLRRFRNRSRDFCRRLTPSSEGLGRGEGWK